MKKNENIDGIEFSYDELELLINFILSHKKEYIQQFLKDRKLHYSYTKPLLRAKIYEGIENENYTKDDLIELLDTIEEYGNQHIYLFNVTDNYRRQLQNKTFIIRNLKKEGLEDVFNNSKPLLLPDKPTICSIVHNSNIYKIKWVEKRVWKDLIDEKIEGDKLIKTYQIHLKRGITTFRVDLITGNAELMIQRLPSGTNYRKVKDEYLNYLKKIFNVDTLSIVNIRSAITRIENSDEVERRQTNFETISGGKASFKSKKRGADYINDPYLKKAREAMGQNVSAELGNFYWLPNDVLKRKIHTHIYSSDNRVGIFGECTQQEVDYVLSRIRYFAS